MKASNSLYSKQNQKTGKTPIYMRVCIRSKKSESRANTDLTTAQLIVWDPITPGVSEKASLINTQLNKLEGKFTDFLGINATLLQFNAGQIKDFILGIDHSKM